MGADASKYSQSEIEDLQNLTKFSQGELKRLFRRFQKLDKDGSGTITVDEFNDIPDLQMNPLLTRVISIFDTNKDSQVEFSEFIQALSIFTNQSSEEEKLKFAFKVYDMDDDGFISNGELFQVLKMMVGSNLSDVQLQQIVDKSILEGDSDHDGKISFEEFCQMVSKTDISQKMTIQL
eukprot:GCRY01001543.1.p1 GENE.GCRY01001543.1~~GCRY01001543.1.p1  ORF type:complete len:178 (+),score=24.50 GCRY01001543.1:205-738(+)